MASDFDTLKNHNHETVPSQSQFFPRVKSNTAGQKELYHKVFGEVLMLLHCAITTGIPFEQTALVCEDGIRKIMMSRNG